MGPACSDIGAVAAVVFMRGPEALMQRPRRLKPSPTLWSRPKKRHDHSHPAKGDRPLCLRATRFGCRMEILGHRNPNADAEAADVRRSAVSDVPSRPDWSSSPSRGGVASLSDAASGIR